MRRIAVLVGVLALGLAPGAAAKAPKSSTVGDPHSPYADCDNFDPAVCLQPFPNNLFTKPSSTSATGLQVSFALTSMPRNAAGRPIQPDEWNRNDGFSPGSLITTLVPGLDLAKTQGVPIDDLGRTYAKDAAVVVIDASTLRRNLIWTEMDANATSASTRNLIVRPAKNFREGHTYIVALRDMKDSSGVTIPAGAGFAGYRDAKTQDARTAHMDWIFSRLAKAGIARKNLFLAWDFTVASEKNLSERMLHIRDDAFAQLGDTNMRDLKVAGSSPAFQVTGMTDFQPCSAGNDPNSCESGESDRIMREVKGRVLVPCYLTTPACQSGGQFLYGLDGLPTAPELEQLGDKWRPHRTLASLYLWASLRNQPI